MGVQSVSTLYFIVFNADMTFIVLAQDDFNVPIPLLFLDLTHISLPFDFVDKIYYMNVQIYKYKCTKTKDRK